VASLAKLGQQGQEVLQASVGRPVPAAQPVGSDDVGRVVLEVVLGRSQILDPLLGVGKLSQEVRASRRRANHLGPPTSTCAYTPNTLKRPPLRKAILI
jgi:hypothetical protein